MKMTSLAPLLLQTLLFLFSPGVYGSSTGAPATACTSMTPNHGPNKAQTGTSLYQIQITTGSEYTSGQKFSITLKSISGSDMFAGFLIQARATGSTNPVGTFTASPNLSQISCVSNFGNALTHVSSTSKSSVAIEWTAPAASTGTITFYATFVKAYTTFWVMVPSAPISPASVVIPTTTTSTTKAPNQVIVTTTTTTKAPNQVNVPTTKKAQNSVAPNGVNSPSTTTTTAKSKTTAAKLTPHKGGASVTIFELLIHLLALFAVFLIAKFQ